MGQNGSSSSEQDNMFDAIEEAVDNLFTQYEKKDDQGAPAVAAAPTQALELETNADLDKACGKVADLLADLNQALLTIDWEVSEANVSKARALLTAIRQEMALAADSIVAKLIDLMDQVLKAIGTAPESVPTSGPKALQDSLDTLTQAAMQGAALDATTKNLIETAIEELKDSLPAAGSAQAARSAKAAKVKEAGSELHMEEKDAETVPAPAALLNIMRTNLSALEQVTNRLAPVENLFTQKPGYEKLVAIYRKLRETMNHQKTVLSTALKLEYHAAPSTSDAPVPAELRQDIQAHISVLGQCVNRINPVTALFAKSPKFAKLHTIHEKLRTQIEQQIDTFTRALQGDYKPPVFLAECSTPPSADIPCPWPKVRLGQWRGKTVAFIPESVAYEKGANRWTKTHLSMLAVFPLRKLKPWPWSRLRTLLNGTLATQQESTLKDLTLPVLNHPDPIQHSQFQPTADTLCILYRQDKGGVILLDQPTTEVVVQENWKWQPSKRTASIISGTLKTAEASIPVIDLNLL